MSTRTHRRTWLSAALACCLSLVVTAPQVSAQQSPVYPEATGRTVVHADGVTGITLLLPQPVRIWQRNLNLVAGEDTRYAFVGLRSQDMERLPDVFCDFCFRIFTSFYPEFDATPSYSRCSDDDGDEIGCVYPAGPVELYFATDGPVTFAIELEGLDGVTELTATAGVGGVVEELPVRGCDRYPDGTCGRVYGGASRVIGGAGRPAIGWAIGYVRAPSSTVLQPVSNANPGLQALAVCAYPSSLFAGSNSGDPNDHPRGCDADPLPAVALSGTAAKRGDVNWKADGQQYLGFSVWTERLFEPGFWNAWGMWLEAGMTCASGDFHNCAG